MRGTSSALMSPARDRMADAYLYGLLFAGAVAAFCLRELIGTRLGLSADLLAIAGGATCGWSWLVIRALFQQPGSAHPLWPLALVLAMIATESVLRLDEGAPAPVLRIVGNVEGLVSSTLLLLAAIEPLRRIRGVPRSERRFRLIVAGGYAAMLAVAVLWIDGAPAGSAASRLGGTIKVRVHVNDKGVVEGADVIKDSVGDPWLVGHAYFALKDAVFPKQKRDPVFEFELRPINKKGK